MKNPSTEYIDTIISAEIPDPDVDPNGHAVVQRSMIHGPCGSSNTRSPCMVQGRRSKHFLKKYCEKTTIGEDGFPVYKRRNTGICVEKNNTLLDNRFVIPYNRDLLVKFDAHINVELCNSARSIKYLFKYINKGPDRISVTIEPIRKAEQRDEIKTYLDCRYISATEACWRIFQFNIHYRKPAVERLPFHLPGEHTVVFEENKCVENVLTNPGIDRTKFTEWLQTNKQNEDARALTYTDFPKHWKDLLCTSYKWRTFLYATVNGVTYPTFKSACYALGLLDDDKEWMHCLSEAVNWATCNELRNLFVTILIHCQVSDVTQLWKAHSTTLSEDMLALQRKRFKVHDLQLNEQQIEAYTLLKIESLMQKLGKSLQGIDECHNLIHRLQEILNEEGKLFFISGPGGTGKTFLWNTITEKLRSESMIVLPATTSAIASLLLPNGRTAHSRFHIPLDVTAESTCEIKHGTQLAALLQKTSLIIWDEAPMANKYCFEALDKTLRDILSTRYKNSKLKPFGGMTMVCGGDFRQILPVIPKGTRADIVGASLNSSYLWPHFTTYELKQNMRLHREGLDATEAAQLASFGKWLLQIGDGSLYEDAERELIRVPIDMCEDTGEEPIEAIVRATYPSLLKAYRDPAYLQERAILTPKNETVHEVNEYLMKKIPGEMRTYLSCDSVCKASVKSNNEDLLYPTKFLHSLKFSGIPNHDIRLKEGTPIMLLRNLNQSEGLCNGTRLIVTRLGKWSIRADIISGTKIGQNITIPRIIMSPNESKWPFKLNRRPLPLAPCFAMTINKSQGQSSKHVGLYLPRQVFTHGQLYVALSRVTSREGLVIINNDDEVEERTLLKNIFYKEIFKSIHDNPNEQGAAVCLWVWLLLPISKQAWKKLGAMPPEEAIQKYIVIVRELIPTWLDGAPIKKKSEGGSDTQHTDSKGPMGPIFSSHVYEEESADDIKIDAIHDRRRTG